MRKALLCPRYENLLLFLLLLGLWKLWYVEYVRLVYVYVPICMYVVCMYVCMHVCMKNGRCVAPVEYRSK